jgi:hypothetical protein
MDPKDKRLRPPADAEARHSMRSEFRELQAFFQVLAVKFDFGQNS